MKQEIKNGLSIVVRFAIEPNMYGFCGEKSDQEILRRGIKGKDLPSVRKTLTGDGFPHLNAFLNTNAKILHQDPFSDAVVNAYWFGNDLTENTLKEGREILISEYKKFIPILDKALEKKLPPKLYLTHLSQVILIAANDNPETEQNMIINQCMVAKAKVISVNPTEKTAIVKRDTLVKNKQSGYDVVTKKQKVKLDPDLTPTLNQGELVAIHLGFVAKTLSEKDAKNLSKWTKKVAKTVYTGQT